MKKTFSLLGPRSGLNQAAWRFDSVRNLKRARKCGQIRAYFKHCSNSGNIENSSDCDIQNIADPTKNAVEGSLNASFNVWSIMGHELISFDPAQTPYRIRVLADDNGHVKVKNYEERAWPPLGDPH